MQRKQLIFILFLFFISSFSFAQDKFTISGFVRDVSSGEELISATIYVKELKTGILTNNYGFYSLTLPKGKYTLSISYMGFQTREISVDLNENIHNNIDLQPVAFLNKEVEIVGKRKNENVQNTDVGKVELDIEKAKAIPAIMGEVDILKTIQLLPGVKSAGEGSSGFYVRGGGSDQNLILLDEAIVFNTGHLFGFFSVFNSDAVKNTTLIKGGMPANYGGRLSSVVDVTMKEGNNKQYHGAGGIGLIASKLTLEGPIIKDKSSFMISARRTYADFLAKPFMKGKDFEGNGYYFYDLNTKINYRISEHDRIFISGYFGRDVFTFNSPNSDFKIRIPWGNATTTVRWNHLFSDKLFLNTSAIYNDYHFAMQMISKDFNFSTYSGIRDWSMKADFSYFPNTVHKIKFGGNYTYHTFIPGASSASTSDSLQLDTKSIPKKYAHETAMYIVDNFDLNNWLKVDIGLRFSTFTMLAPYSQLVKDSLGEVTDTIFYHKGDKVKTYYGFEPRINLRFKINDKSSVKASYNYNNQYIHLVSNSASTLPTDIWVPSSRLVNPQKGYQLSVGYFRNFFKNTVETSVEIYYKKMFNQIEYRDGYTIQWGRDLEWDFVFGQGQSYGVELFINKTIGKLTGWVGYTWSKTTRHFPDLATVDFPTKYDRTNDLSVVAVYEPNKRMSFAATFVYGTGEATTIPLRRYVIDNRIVNEYSPRNSYRLEPYHRADVSATIRNKPFDKSGKPRKVQSEWVVSIYNVYNHKNIYFIYYNMEGDIYKGDLKIQAKKVSLFPIIPSISWNFKF